MESKQIWHKKDKFTMTKNQFYFMKVEAIGETLPLFEFHFPIESGASSDLVT